LGDIGDREGTNLPSAPTSIPLRGLEEQFSLISGTFRVTLWLWFSPINYTLNDLGLRASHHCLKCLTSKVMEGLGIILAKSFHSILDQMATLMTIRCSWVILFLCHIVPDNDLTAFLGRQPRLIVFLTDDRRRTLAVGFRTLISSY